MRIPLDFYRILGVPIQATPEQIEQAYQDRLQQLPRHEYSNAAISARKQLLAEAYAVFSDPEQRQAYDENFLGKNYISEGLILASLPLSPEMEKSENSGIDIQDQQLAGALLLLQELGEYELVLKLGQPYLSSGILDLKRPHTGSALSEADIVLTLSLAHLELGREQWQQGQYEMAAQSLQEGLKLLLREGLFSDIQNEIRADLYKLRPYRILELLALPEEKKSERAQGLTLLKEMLAERGGIDGTDKDQSGLSIDDFLRFIQQLRNYLTVAEQQEIFETEARRPSAVATYLAVYALIARGFAQRQPALIRRAKVMLARLTSHQDVYLEQAVCALLLGQTEEASQVLELSHEYESLAFIREYSVDSPDLIPGLYLYTERWLQEEVYPYFRDLVEQQVSLRDYFGDEQIQSYLDELVPETTQLPISHSAEAAQPILTSAKDAWVTSDSQSSSASTDEATRWTSLSSAGMRQPVRDRTADVPQTPSPELATASSVQASKTTADFTGLSGAGRSLTASKAAKTPQPPDQLAARIADRRPRPTGSTPARRRRSRSTSHPYQRLQLVGLILLGILGIGAMAAIAKHLVDQFQSPAPVAVSSPPPLVAGEQPLVDLTHPPVPIPDVGNSPASDLALRDTDKGSPSLMPTGSNQPLPLTKDTAKQLIQNWQLIKAEALGENHTTSRLQQILTEPALSEWLASAQQDKATKAFWQYNLNHLDVQAVNAQSSEQASVKATVNETAKLYQRGQLQPDRSYTDVYQVEYILARQKNQWLIQDMRVLR